MSAQVLNPPVASATHLKVDLDLVRKYNVPGPRYTSYPPANHFCELTDEAGLLEEVRQNNQTTRDLSLYFHLPFCQSLCWYCGCTTVITTQQKQSAVYLEYLQKELALMAPWLNPDRQVVQFHLGGGTPTFLLPDEIRQLGNLIHGQFKISPAVEGGVEIDPRRLTRDHLSALREIGCNRASLGVQDHNPDVQRAVHRIQPREQTERAVDWIRAEGFQSLNIDLIYGLPHQTVASFERTLDDVIRLDPDRLAVFSYAHVPWIKPSQKILEDHSLPSADTKFQLLKLTIEKLTDAGWIYIGMDHFAKAQDELAVAQRNRTLQRNFQGYSTCGEADIYSFGMSSISQAGSAYWQNQKELPAYCSRIDSDRLPWAKACLLSAEDKIRRQVIMRLMCDLGLDYAEMSECLGLDFAAHFASELHALSDLEADGLITTSDHDLSVTASGRLFIRNIAMRFDAYIKSNSDRRYSRTI
jgi:oxygen-independent coproporphyrinogen III oxidase